MKDEGRNKFKIEKWGISGHPTGSCWQEKSKSQSIFAGAWTELGNNVDAKRQDCSLNFYKTVQTGTELEKNKENKETS